MKIHDYHVFMKAVLPIAFSAFPANVWEPLSSLGEFFENLCVNVLCEDHLMGMHCNIVLILCNLETTFLSGFWNVVEHLLVRLAQEVHLGGPTLMPKRTL